MSDGPPEVLMMRDMLVGKVVVVTGAASGIGKATAELCAQAGAAVLLADTDDAHGQAATDVIVAAGARAAYVHCDVSREPDVIRMVHEVIERFGRLDGAFNNAGTEGTPAAAADIDDGAWDRLMAVNLTGVMRCVRGVVN